MSSITDDFKRGNQIIGPHKLGTTWQNTLMWFILKVHGRLINGRSKEESIFWHNNNDEGSILQQHGNVLTTFNDEGNWDSFSFRTDTILSNTGVPFSEIVFIVDCD